MLRYIRNATNLALLLVSCGLIFFQEMVHFHFLRIATRFDEEGHVSNPDWLHRPIMTVTVILVVYALLRLLFQRMTGRALETWLFVGQPPHLLRGFVAVSVFLVMPALFVSFAYATTNPGYWSAYYGEDQIFENLTAAFLIIGAIMLAVAARRIFVSDLAGRGWLSGGFILAGLSILVVGLEEMSYGQRLFGWQTPPAVSAANLQAETNLHNYWTHAEQGTVLWVIGLVLFLGAGVSVLIKHSWQHPWSTYVPDQAFLPIAAVILALTSHAGFHELLEQIVALTALLWGCQVLATTSRQARRISRDPRMRRRESDR